MDAVIVRLVREAVAGDWEAIGLLLDRLEDMQDKRQEQLLAVLGSAKERIDSRSRGPLRFPHDVASALGEVRSWLRTAFWAELLDGGPKALLASLAALEKAHGCNEGPHPQMSMGTTYAYPMEMPLRPTTQEVAQAVEAVQRFVRNPPAIRPLSDSVRAVQEDAMLPEPVDDDPDYETPFVR